MNPPTNWTPGLIALGISLAIGAVYVIVSLLRAKPAGEQSEAQRRAAELEAKYQSAIQQLRELKAEQHHLTPEAYEAQKAELERRAADALRDKERGAPPLPAIAARPAGAGLFARRPELKGALWGGGVVAFFAVLGFLLLKEGKPATDGNGPMQGGPMQSQGMGGPQEPPGGDDLPRALEHLREHPEDTESASLVGHELIRRQDWQQASEVTERSLGMDPFHVENRIHRAVLKTVRGDPAGEVELQRLADTYPGSHEALLFLASAVAQAGDKARALDALERYVSVAPPAEQSVEIYQAMAQFRRELGLPPAP